MRLFTTLLVALLSIVGASNLNAQVTVSHEDTATDPNEITTGYYVIKAKAKTIANCWLYMDNTTTKATESIDNKNIWYVEKNDNNTLYIKNEVTGKYFKAGNNATLNATTNKSDASQFSISTSFTNPGDIAKLDDKAVVLYAGTPTETDNRQVIHTNGTSVSSFYLTTWISNTAPAIQGTSAVTQFAFYKAEIGNDLTASPVASSNNLYYLQNKSTGSYLGKEASTGKGCYVATQSEAKQFYLDKQSDGRFKLISDNTQMTISNTVWYMPLTSEDGGKVYFTLTNAGGDYFYIRNNSNGAPQYMTSGTIGSIIQKSTSQNDNCKWAFVPANETATTARDLTIKVNAGDEVHGNIATFSASYPVALPTDYTAYYATYNADENYLQMNAIEGNVIPANTGVIVKGAQNATLSMKPSLEEATAVSADNKLASVGDNAYTFTDSDTNIYLLGKSKTSGELSFIRMNTSGTQTIGAHKAYLNLSDVSTESLNAIQMHFGGVIESVNTIVKNDKEDADAPYYDLSGRRVLAPQHGIYIKGGKKVIIK